MVRDLTEAQEKEIDAILATERRIRNTDAMLRTVPKFKLRQEKFKNLIANLTIVRTNNAERFRKFNKKGK